MTTTDLIFLPGDVYNGGMLLGSRDPGECMWRPAVEITDLVDSWLVGFAHHRVSESRRTGRMEGRSGLRSREQKIADDYHGNCGEYAVAKYLDMFWEPKFDPGNREADLGPDIQIRTTDCLWGNLIIRPTEKHRTQRHVMTVVHGCHVAVVGWASGADVIEGGRFSRYWDQDRNSWWIPMKELRPMDELVLAPRACPRWW